MNPLNSFNYLVPTAEHSSPYTVITPTYSPDTTIAITLRQFEKDSKTQAEGEFDTQKGPLPDVPPEDDPSIDIQERIIQKRKRKVRSAIVSRRKNAIYETKLEDEVRNRDGINAEIKNSIALYSDVIRDLAANIQAMEKNISMRRHSAPKRIRTAHVDVSRVTKIAQPDNVFFLEDNTIDDILNVSPQHNRVPAAAPMNKHLAHYRDADLTTSECSDRQMSPMVPRVNSTPATVPDLPQPPVFAADDPSFKYYPSAYLSQKVQHSANQFVGSSFAI